MGDIFNLQVSQGSIATHFKLEVFINVQKT